MRSSVVAAIALAGLASTLTAQTPVVTATGENMRLRASSVQALGGSSWRITLTVDDDNGNGSLPNSYRRWWHCHIGNLDPTRNTTLQVRVTNAGYSDVILPAWARSTDGGQRYNAYSRVPTSAVPRVSGSTHTFTLSVPAGVTDIKLAKYLPYTVSDKDSFIGSLAGHPSGHVGSVGSIGNSTQGRSIQRIQITDNNVPDFGKQRVWIQAGIHPAENTSYFIVEGLVNFLLSGAPDAELLLDRLIFDIVPMANPDGVFLGNYRTNSRSTNLENEWVAPYRSTVPEVVALRREIERLMGTSAQPGRNPIEFLFNLHSSHNVSYPFHFQHIANPAFNLRTSRSGVIPVVNQKEAAWIAAFRSRSAFTSRGRTASSTVGAPTRPFVESMMHDRWSIDPAWTGPPNNRQEVMAITYEGTYGRGPDGLRWNTAADYRRNGMEMALALGDVTRLFPGGTAVSYGAPCGGVFVSSSVVPNPNRLILQTLGAAPNSPAWLVLGTTRQASRLLPPPTNCLVRTDLALVVPTTTTSAGTVFQSLRLPAVATHFFAQYVAVDLSGVTPRFQSTNGIEVTFVP